MVQCFKESISTHCYDWFSMHLQSLWKWLSPLLLLLVSSHHITVPHHATVYYATPHHATLYHATLHQTTPHHTTPHHTTPRHATPHHTTPHHTTPHHTTPCHTTPHHTTPNHTTPHHTTPHQTTHSGVAKGGGFPDLRLAVDGGGISGMREQPLQRLQAVPHHHLRLLVRQWR